MNQAEIMEVMERNGAILANSHFVYAAGDHGSNYINKDAIFLNPHDTSMLATEIVNRLTAEDWFMMNCPEVVAGPAIGGAILAQWVGYHLAIVTGVPIKSVYCERIETLLASADKSALIMSDRTLSPGEQMLIRSTRMAFKRGYDKVVAGKRVLVDEDVFTTGMSAANTVSAVRAAGGTVVAVCGLANRGGVTKEVLEVPMLECLVNIDLPKYPATECPLCAAGVPINTQFGKGKAFLERKAKEAGSTS